MLNNIIDEIRSIFNINNLEISRNKMFDNKYGYGSAYELNIEKCAIFILYPNDNSAYIASIDKCTLNGISTSGTEIVLKCKQLAKTTNLKRLNLMDTSIIDYNNCYLSLFTYYIIINGYSWYNKFGFISENYKNELKHNNDIRNLSVLECINIINDGPNYSINLNFFKILFPDIDLSLKISDVVKTLVSRLRNTDHVICEDNHTKYILSLISGLRDMILYNENLTWINPDYL